MKKSDTVLFAVLLAGFLAAPFGRAAAQTDQDAIAVVRSVLKADRQSVVAHTLQLTDAEAQGFWPLYQQYRAEMDEVADGLLKLTQEYAGYYPDVPEDRARQMLKTLGKLEKKRVATRIKYLKKTGKVLPADKNLRFAQVENRLDLAVQLKMAATIPLVPIEGHLTGEMTGAAAIAQGVPGGTAVQTYELTATVTAIDKANRRVTLLSPDGIKQTVKAGPEVVNFDQIHVGDQLKVRATQELVVYVVGAGETPDSGAAQLVALAPKGAKPGGIMATTTQLTAKVAAIDLEHHQATLQFADGTTRTVAVRDDVDLSKRKVGDQVVIRTTGSLLIQVQNQ